MIMMMLENGAGSSKEAQLRQSWLSRAVTILDMHQTPSAIDSRRIPGNYDLIGGSEKILRHTCIIWTSLWAEDLPMKGVTGRPDLSRAGSCIVGRIRVGVVDGRSGDWQYLVEIGGLSLLMDVEMRNCEVPETFAQRPATSPESS